MQSTLNCWTKVNRATADPSVDIVFGFMSVDQAGTRTYTATSPQGDLAGKPILTWASNKTRAGIVSRAVKIVVPIYNAGTAKYEGTIQARIVLNAPSACYLSKATEALQELVSLFSPFPDNTGGVDDTEAVAVTNSFIACS